MPGVGYVRLDGVREPIRVRAGYLTDPDIAAMAAEYAPRRVLDGEALFQAAEGDVAGEVVELPTTRDVGQPERKDDGAVLWNWHAPALWNRFVTELVRALAADAGLSERAWRNRVRVAYAKVAEFQARGLVHFHAIIRLDSAEDRALAPGLQVTADELCTASRPARRARAVAGSWR